MEWMRKGRKSKRGRKMEGEIRREERRERRKTRLGRRVEGRNER